MGWKNTWTGKNSKTPHQNFHFFRSNPVQYLGTSIAQPLKWGRCQSLAENINSIRIKLIAIFQQRAWNFYAKFHTLITVHTCMKSRAGIWYSLTAAKLWIIFVRQHRHCAHSKNSTIMNNAHWKQVSTIFWLVTSEWHKLYQQSLLFKAFSFNSLLYLLTIYW